VDEISFGISVSNILPIFSGYENCSHTLREEYRLKVSEKTGKENIWIKER
jgi:hypothetical protein